MKNAADEVIIDYISRKSWRELAWAIRNAFKSKLQLNKKFSLFLI